VPFSSLDEAVQRGFGDLEGPANICNRVPLVVEILGNTELFAGKGLGSAAFPSSGSCCHKAGICPLSLGVTQLNIDSLAEV
jgi:hypothetical protein